MVGFGDADCFYASAEIVRRPATLSPPLRIYIGQRRRGRGFDDSRF